MKLLLSATLTFLFLVTASQAQLKGRYHPDSYKRRTFTIAANHLKVPFLCKEREWERIDIYVPKDSSEKKLPCVVLFYGGGWGGKNMGGVANEIQPLLEKGYVVAVPDYVLGASHPVPLAIWDGATAIRFLRKNAAKYRLDPERIGVWGFSAGGWLVQYLGPSDSTTQYQCQSRVGPKKRTRIYFQAPMVEPDPLYPEYSAKVQGIVTDWGAGRLKEKRMLKNNPNWLSSDDPPLLTCHNDPSGAFPPGPELYKKAGAPTEVAYLKVRNTHVPSTKTPAKGKYGKAMTWRGRIHQFFDEHVKNPKWTTPPEILPAGGFQVGATSVNITSVHPEAKIFFTTDGSKPTQSSRIFVKPFQVKPRTTVRAIARKEGLKPSRITTVHFHPGKFQAPKILITQNHFVAKKGQPFSISFKAAGKVPVEWYVAGKLGNIVPKVSRHKEVPWLSMNRQSGLLTGTPNREGVYPFVLVANAVEEGQVIVDAKKVIVTVE